MKPTIRNLAKYLGKSESSLYAMRKAHPKQWALLWDGWVNFAKIKSINMSLIKQAIKELDKNEWLRFYIKNTNETLFYTKQTQSEKYPVLRDLVIMPNVGKPNARHKIKLSGTYVFEKLNDDALCSSLDVILYESLNHYDDERLALLIDFVKRRE